MFDKDNEIKCLRETCNKNEFLKEKIDITSKVN